ncbi:hypothetical protein BH708_11890 [Brachybacterium sp. P6-10-X1]|uniref:hypothetical protein n=1 Tax=Brachybacterium sp. P6-10-X1 TaxID=1903186 RepID=UPI000971B8FD|nr:hypothetical protein [Brachybacterium sp. P6-10-X1]APX33294.1 hypothetical protein BH708_11890 [Brachybacterium sp. P6-10-X1]
MKRRQLFTGVGSATLLTVLGIPAIAHADDSTDAPALDGVDRTEVPAFAGGTKHGVVETTETISGHGTFSARLNCDTGDLTTTDPDGSITTKNVGDLTTKLQDMLNRASDEDLSALSGPSAYGISASDVCPYLTTVIGYGHAATWAYALTLIAVNPAIAILVGLGEAVFWTWVSTHC